MKVFVALDQTPVACNGEAVILGVYRKRKAAMRRCQDEYEKFTIASKRRPLWRPWIKGELAFTEIYYQHSGREIEIGLVVERWEVQ